MQGLSQEQTHALYTVCKQIGDKRAARGKQYNLVGLLMVLVLAKLAGMKSQLDYGDGRDRFERRTGDHQVPCGADGSGVRWSEQHMFLLLVFAETGDR